MIVDENHILNHENHTLKYVAGSDGVELLYQMLQRYTPSGEERHLSEWVAQHVAPYGLITEVDAVGNCIITVPPTTQMIEPPIVLLGHIDTVPGHIDVQFGENELQQRILYGRGAVDAKGPLAAFISAAIRVIQQVPNRNRSVIVVGAVEEEAATSRGARAIVENDWQPAYCIIGEPSGVDAITLGYKGRLLATFQAEQPVRHTATAEGGIAVLGVNFWQAIQSIIAETHAHIPQAQGYFSQIMPSIRSFQTASDGFQDRVTVEVGFRLPPAMPPSELELLLVAAGAQLGGIVMCRGHEAAYHSGRSGNLQSAFVRAIRAQGLSPSFKLKTGTSDMNVVGPIWRCPIVAYGPGDSNLDHTPHEHISIAEFEQSIEILTNVLADFIVPAERNHGQVDHDFTGERI